jgi:hypothetical protein
MVVTNDGEVSFSYSNPYGWVEAQTAATQTNGEMDPLSSGSLGFVRPHSYNEFSVWLPRGTLQWQCRFLVRASSLRERAFDKMFLANLDAPDWLLRLFPNREGKEIELKSEVYQVATNAQNTVPLEPPPMQR